MSRRPVDIKDKQVLDLVAAGESNGDYNAVYGIRVGSSQQPDFSRMTISEVRQYQRQRIASGQPSSAVGKYQFIQSTLDETTQRAGFNPDTTYFTPEVQDQLMTTRLDQRGLSSWKNGNMSNAQFQDNLAKEFASVPVATAQQGAHKSLQPGDGYYDGDGINSASHVDATRFSNNLNRINNESGSQFVNGDVDTGESADANTGSWTPPIVPLEPAFTPSYEKELAEKAARNNKEANDELVLGYTESVEQYFENNPNLTQEQVDSSEFANKAFQLATSDNPVEQAQGLAMLEALDNVAGEKFSKPQGTGSDSVTDMGAVTEGIDIDYIEDSNDNRIRPTPNWYTSVDLATYNWTFYLVTPDVFNNPEAHLMDDSSSLRLDTSQIICKTGLETLFSIDNLLFLSKMFGDASKGSVMTSQIQFEVKEPMGFTLLERILNKSVQYNFNTMRDAKYVLKLELKGRDPVNSQPIKYEGVHFFPVMATSITADTNEGGTSYIFTGSSIPALGAAEAVVKTGSVTVKDVTTMETFVEKLTSQLNRSEIEAITPPIGNPVNSTQLRARKTWNITINDNAKSGAYGDPRGQLGTGKYVPDFDLAKMLISTSNSSGNAADMENKDSKHITISNEDNVVTYLRNFITSQPAWKEYYVKTREVRDVDPLIYVTSTPVFKNEIHEPSRQQYVDVNIEIGITMREISTAREKLISNQRSVSYQNDRFDNLPIVKKYEFIYTGKNTEILGLSRQFNLLFGQATDPKNGMNTANSTNEEPGTNFPTTGTFLSDNEYKQVPEDIMATLPRDTQVSSQYQQQSAELTGTTQDLLARYALNYDSRASDMQSVEVEIIGDPYWLGVPGMIVNDKVTDSLTKLNTGGQAFVVLEMYYPDAETLGKGQMDLYTSGVYEVREVEHRFQQGQYTSKLTMYRDHKSNTFILQKRIRNL